MARKQEWTVRVVNRIDGQIPGHETSGTFLPGLWLEQLRYLGMARELASYEDRNVIEFTCPNKRDLDTMVWAEQNAARMRSFGIDAAAAPKWSDGDCYQRPSHMDQVSYMERLNRGAR